MKKTAVEWFREEFNRYYAFSKEEMETFDRMFNQAKEMEKEQIMDAYDKAGKSVFHITGYMLSEKENKDFLITAEQYYNETYKSE
jgi:hypothetical protein